ncbi:HNH endonuclease signature motif containing protein [Corynebacterium breve]|uniref:HNH endonuclease signature motif containing protein n=1 Tax=Corynebacterium breve TaxID=3049799 RepID=A0ABY8VE80_9CORY|nr:HNH endonuclease signature motif containing protein [Corynebacterium breve]WIM67976.1 HNH endonuclease signature motif containing protein [Corynebacterium breve]
MASLENPVCSWPGCGVGAEYCQINHNQAWSAGGETNIDNLATVCRFHNGRNDDDRGSPRYGYLDRIDGHVQHVPPFRGPPKKNSHPVAQGGAMRIV